MERRSRQIYLLITLCSVEWPLVKWLEYLKEVDTNININTLLESRKGSEPQKGFENHYCSAPVNWIYVEAKQHY